MEQLKYMLFAIYGIHLYSSLSTFLYINGNLLLLNCSSYTVLFYCLIHGYIEMDIKASGWFCLLISQGWQLFGEQIGM
jgi:hypothetical protein